MMKNGLVFMSLLMSCHSLVYGPCHDVTTVDVDTSKWPGNLYINVETYNEGARCQWVNRTLVFRDGKVLLWDYFKHIENNIEYIGIVEGEYVSKGHYTFTAQKIAGVDTLFHVYFMYFDPPRLSCHFVCTDDPLFKDGRGEFYCEGYYPDAQKKYAHKIKKIAERNGFDINGLMVVDNCNCPNIPYSRGPSKCEHVSIQKYLSCEK